MLYCFRGHPDGTSPAVVVVIVCLLFSCYLFSVEKREGKEEGREGGGEGRGQGG